jgi:hypothetical protein
MTTLRSPKLLAAALAALLLGPAAVVGPAPLVAAYAGEGGGGGDGGGGGGGDGVNPALAGNPFADPSFRASSGHVSVHVIDDKTYSVTSRPPGKPPVRKVKPRPKRATTFERTRHLQNGGKIHYWTDQNGQRFVTVETAGGAPMPGVIEIDGLPVRTFR